MLRVIRFLRISMLNLSIILVVTGCFQSSNVTRQTDQEEALASAEARIGSVESNIENLNRQITENQAYIDLLTKEYQNFYFDICTEVESKWCSTELQYFDPRTIHVGEKLFDMTVSSISVGEYDPGSYIVSLEGDVEATGQYTFVKDGYQGDHYTFETETVGNQVCKLSFSLADEDLGTAGVMEQFNSNNGFATVKISKMTLMRLPHKPGQNVAIVDSIR